MSKSLFVVLLALSYGGSLFAASPVLTNEANPDVLHRKVEGKVKVLNNLCWELCSEKLTKQENVRRFELPVDRWAFIKSQATINGSEPIDLYLDNDPDPIVHHQVSGDVEAMHFLKAGTHELRCAAKSDSDETSVVVRAVPALRHSFYGAKESLITQFGPYDWKFLEKYINPNANVMVDLGQAAPPTYEIDSWKKSGRQWLSHSKILWDIDPAKQGEAARLQKFWEGTVGVRNTASQGIVLDEFGENNSQYDIFRDACQYLSEGSLKGRSIHIYAYGNGLAESENGREFGNWIIEHGGDIAVEWYLLDTPDLPSAKKKIQEELVGGMKRWSAAFSPEHLVAALCNCNQPAESGNRCPQTDFNVLLDMQMESLANDPAFFGLGGVEMYYSGYADEEILRWGSKLFRHYCLEGHTERLSQEPYELTHIANPDFAKGENGWTIKPAEKGSAEVKSFPGLGILQSRWGGSQTGDHFLWMRRCAKTQNEVSQTIKNLTPGKCYSLKLISSDYDDLTNGRSASKWPPVIVKLDGVELLEGRKQSFVCPFPHSFGRTQGAFNPQHQYWNNYHWQVFKATSPSAKLTISDWWDAEHPCGPIDQEFLISFVEIQPYLED